MSLNIVLIEPEIPQNTGNIARTCAAIGAALHLVKPMGFSIDEKQVKRAGLDYWHLLKIYEYDNLEAFLSAHGEKELFFATTKADKTYCDVTYSSDCFLVFGKETKGLPESLLFERMDRAIRIPMMGEARSLNLANSVAVIAYEALRQQGFSALKHTGELTQYPAKSAEGII